MPLLMFEIITVSILLLTGITGIQALRIMDESHKDFNLFKIQRFNVCYYENQDLWKFLVYFALIISVTTAFLSIFLRLVWFNDVIENKWTYWWLAVHCLDGIGFIAVHILVYIYYKRKLNG